MTAALQGDGESTVQGRRPAGPPIRRRTVGPSAPGRVELRREGSVSRSNSSISGRRPGPAGEADSVTTRHKARLADQKREATPNAASPPPRSPLSAPTKGRFSKSRLSAKGTPPLGDARPAPTATGSSVAGAASSSESGSAGPVESSLLFPSGAVPKLGSGSSAECPRLTPQQYAVQFPGAISLESEVFAWHPARAVWFSATIIHARPRKRKSATISPRSPSPLLASPDGARWSRVQGEKGPPSGTLSVVDDDACSSEAALKVVRSANNFTPKIRSIDKHSAEHQFDWSAAAEFEYYVHFHGEDRRHDVWVSPASLRPSNFKFHPDEPSMRVAPGLDEIHKHMDVEYLREHEENTKLKTIGNVVIGKYCLEAWYFSPYPKEFQNLDTLYVCESCLLFFKHECELLHHVKLCQFYHPPGDEIYREVERNLSIFEVDGAAAAKYSENLCFLSKLFLDHKTLRHPVYLFLFYVLCEFTEGTYKIVGYFSKEKHSKNNLSCILCLPQHQRKGYGQLLISLSYALFAKEGQAGTPERPLSDLGRVSYIKYWSQCAVAALLSARDVEAVSLEALAKATSIECADLAMALGDVGILRCCQTREWLPFLFLPDEFVTATSAWARPAFTNVPISSEYSALLDSKHPLPRDSHPKALAVDPSTVSAARAAIGTAAADSAARVAIGTAAVDSAARAAIGTAAADSAARVAIGTAGTGRVKRKRLSPSDGDERRGGKRARAAPQHDKAEGVAARKALGLGRRDDSSSALVNLAHLHWESYDLHLGPLEFAPLP